MPLVLVTLTRDGAPTDEPVPPGVTEVAKAISRALATAALQSRQGAERPCNCDIRWHRGYGSLSKPLVNATPGLPAAGVAAHSAEELEQDRPRIGQHHMLTAGVLVHELASEAKTTGRPPRPLNA